jgi:hypothetical protein
MFYLKALERQWLVSSVVRLSQATAAPVFKVEAGEKVHVN